MFALNKNKGFTLIELLVVIAIIGLLASIAMVNLNAARNKAKVASVKGSISALQSGMVLCEDANANIMAGAGVLCATNALNIPSNSAGAAFCDVGSFGQWPIINGFGANYGNCNANLTNSTFSYNASIQGCVMTCNHASCTFVGTNC